MCAGESVSTPANANGANNCVPNCEILKNTNASNPAVSTSSLSLTASTCTIHPNTSPHFSLAPPTPLSERASLSRSAPRHLERSQVTPPRVYRHVRAHAPERSEHDQRRAHVRGERAQDFPVRDVRVHARHVVRIARRHDVARFAPPRARSHRDERTIDRDERKKNNILLRPRARLRERALDDARASLSRSESQPSTRGWGVRDSIESRPLDLGVYAVVCTRLEYLLASYFTIHEPIDRSSSPSPTGMTRTG